MAWMSGSGWPASGAPCRRGSTRARRSGRPRDPFSLDRAASRPAIHRSQACWRFSAIPGEAPPQSHRTLVPRSRHAVLLASRFSSLATVLRNQSSNSGCSARYRWRSASRAETCSGVHVIRTLRSSPAIHSHTETFIGGPHHRQWPPFAALWSIDPLVCRPRKPTRAYAPRPRDALTCQTSRLFRAPPSSLVCHPRRLVFLANHHRRAIANMSAAARGNPRRLASGRPLYR
jgi:hypothetical protein